LGRLGRAGALSLLARCDGLGHRLGGAQRPALADLRHGRRDQRRGAADPCRESAAEIAAQLRQATSRLPRVAHAAPDLDAVVFRFTDGRELSAGQRLEMIARHWRSHLQQLQEASG